MVRPALAAALLAGALLPAACITPAQNRQDALPRVIHEYNGGLRWKRYDQVTSHLTDADVQRFAVRAAAFGDDYEMADEEVVAIEPVGDEGRRARATVSFSWYDRRQALLRRAVVLEEWTFTGGRWICETQRRLRGDGFPLVPESVPPPPAPAGP